MKVLVISYSLSGNNEDLAASLATTFAADHVRITERKRRTMGTIFLDVMFNRVPKISAPVTQPDPDDLVIFVGPVWLGQVAAPFRACFRQLRDTIGAYAFVSISGGATGPNPKLAGDLETRLGKAPVCLLDLHKADLLPAEPVPTRDDTMAYRITEGEVQQLTDTAVATLRRVIAA